jgi:translocator protein
MSPAALRRAMPIAVAALCAVLVAAIGGAATEIGPWYRALKKPPWQPPDWAFGPAWTVIYTLTAAAGVRAWNAATLRHDKAARRRLIGAFALNALLNIAWSVLFFSFRRPDWALAEVLLLWLSVALLIVVAGRLERLAGWLLLPYLMWVAFAAWLNQAVFVLNRPFG